MTSRYLCGLFLLVTACSGTTVGGGKGDEGTTKQQLKQAASEAAHSNAPAADGDVCANEGWYGDGECDTFCQDADSADCTRTPGDGVVCAEFIEAPNGFCSRLASDPCISQDPDCNFVKDPIVCPAIAQLPDGVCKDDPTNPCLYLSDPDCQGTIDPSQPSGPIVCATVVQAPDGVCTDDPEDKCDQFQDPDCAGGTPGNPGDGEGSDPVVCATYIEESDCVCKRDPADPCIFQDPDCKKQ